jgi:glycosyltransferase involved in cell wall biosynthesis
MKGIKREGKVVYLGIDRNTYSRISLDDKEYDISLIVSNFSKHKNIRKLFDSLEYYKQKYKKEMRIVIIGGDINKKKINIIKKYILNKGLNKLEITGLVSKKDVIRYLIKSKLYISTSLLEAFPLTQFEAIQCNVPIILSDIAVYREICGNFNIYFNPNSPENIADKIHDVFENYEYYYNLIPKIKKYASKFTWENHAKKLIEIFESLL